MYVFVYLRGALFTIIGYSRPSKGLGGSQPGPLLSVIPQASIAESLGASRGLGLALSFFRFETKETQFWVSFHMRAERACSRCQRGRRPQKGSKNTTGVGGFLGEENTLLGARWVMRRALTCFVPEPPFCILLNRR